MLNQDIYSFIAESSEGVSVKEINAKFKEHSQGTISGLLNGMVNEQRIERPKRGVYKVTDQASLSKKGSPLEALLINARKLKTTLNYRNDKLSVEQLEDLVTGRRLLDDFIASLENEIKD